MLLVIIILGIIGVIVWEVLPEKEDDFNMGASSFGIFMLFISTIIGVAAIIIGGATIANHINVDAKFTAKQNKYESLIYQLEISKEDDSVDKYFLYSEIDNWNSELIKEKRLSKNFWIGFLYPDKLYEDFEVIEYK